MYSGPPPPRPLKVDRNGRVGTQVTGLSLDTVTEGPYLEMERGMTLFKPGAWGFVIGSVLTMIVGFNWGGWVTGGGAERIAYERSQTAVTAALVPVCVEKSKTDPALPKKLGALTALTTSWDQREAVLQAGWATIGQGEANRDVAEACASELVKK